VITERPTYDRTLLGLRNRGADVHLVTLEEDGIAVEEVAGLLEGGLRPTLAHVIPNFQNPAGYTLSLAKRERLLELAREHGFVLFEDDPYVDVRFSGEPLPRMLELDGGAASEHVVYASSFSKTVCPGIRVGYLVGPPALIKKIQVRATNTYIAPNMVAQGTVYAYLQGDRFPAALERVKQALAERVGLLDDALRAHLPQASFRRPEGGYFLWVSLPEGEGHDVARITAEASSRGVAIVPGTDFLLEGGENAFRLAYSGVTADVVDEGVRRLAEAIAEVRG
jgi:DNA-binding transcriptional MocR family regulator